MSEELLKAIVQLFAIVAKERITEDERANIKEFLSLHLNQEATRYYLSLFDDFCKANKRLIEPSLNVDEATLEFVDDWSQIIQIAKKVNQALTMQQKAVLSIKIIELCYADGELSERQSNLIYYIGEALKIPQRDVKAMTTFVMGQDIEELASRNILVIDEGSGGDDFPGPRITARDLTGLIAILRLQDIETYLIKYLGITPLYLNSVPLKSRKIDVFATGSSIRGPKIEPIYYSDIVGKFLQEESDTDISFIAEHIFYHFKSGKAGLQNINVAETGGKLIGLMGASGSGKSTLLSVLNGSETPSSGRVLINGIDIHKEPHKVEGIVGFIPQDDLLIENLTVFENLYYSARLCFGHYSIEKISELVERVLLSLGLSEIRNLKVGSPLQKTISGGQRKRLNIGLELLREPTILFVDEPTSGLSSRDSENIMDLLKELSLRGKMIFVVIHQPSSDIFKMFDTLIILDVGGFQIYYGNPVESVNYFQEIINAANKTPGACPECGNINPEQIFNIIETRVVNEFGRFTHTRKISPGQWYQYFKQKIKISKVTEVHDPLPIVQKIPNWFKQLWIFGIRDVLSKLANKQYMVTMLLMPPVLSFFIAYFVKYFDFLGIENPKYTFFHNSNIPVYFFMSVVVALFIGLIISAEEIFSDRKILKRERYLNLSSSSYLISKILILFSLSAIQTLTYILVGNWILEIPLTEIRYWLILFSCSCFSNVLGLNISSAFDSAVTIYILIPLLIIPQLLLSGVVIDFDKFNPNVGTPKGIPVMGEIMASRWAFEAFMVTQFKDNPYQKQFYKLDQKAALAKYKNLYYIPKLRSHLALVINNQRRWRDKSESNPVKKSLDLLRSEIKQELSSVGENRFPYLEKLQIGKFDSVTYYKTDTFLIKLNKYYTIREHNATEAKDSIIRQLTNTPEKLELFDQSRMRFVNEAVNDWVTNSNDPMRIVEWKGELIQKLSPIYFDDHRPSNPLDFRANFYVPTKYFAGKKFDTLSFNISFIWFITILLYIALYFQLFKKLVNSLETYRKYRGKD
ncbi:MAG TPA: ATP-binding cassette domain-containing protein [Cyclobacteriaceae bacterium]|nr:ATP-binding cassette domain-containing protein [Cyclobacteriaceae bacterium]HPW61779.1 ATP-binding cassette domain-containing protein [Cyclobacteriaceae bacterium]